MKSWFKRRRLARGYSMVDVLIGVTVLAIAVSSAFELAIETSRLTSQNMYLSQATGLAEYKIEELRNTTLANVVTGADGGTLDGQGNPGGIFTRNWTVADNMPETGLKTVVVAVAWSQWGQTRTYTLSGVLGQ